MKKLLLIFSFVSFLFLFSCSSDDNDPTEHEIPKKATPYKVDYYITKEDIEKYPKGYGNQRTFILEKTDKYPSGNLGIIVHFANFVEKGYVAYDLCCPIHWEDSDPLKHKLTISIPDDTPFPEAHCDIKGYRSSFTLYWGTPNSGYAREKKINLTEYQISQYPDLLSFEKEIGQHITNPKYKEIVN